MSDGPVPDWQLPPGTNRGLWDYLHNRDMVRRYDVALSTTPLLAIDLRFAAEVFRQPGKLIDLGCGTGRLAFDFASRGFECTGVDLSEEMLAMAREKAAELALAVEWKKANLVELGNIPDGQFDYAACLFSTLGMIRGREHRRRFLEHTFRILKPGGMFVVHAHNRWFQLGTPGGFRWFLGNVWKRIRGRETGDRAMVQAYGGAALSLYHYSKRELGRELRAAGFTVERVQPISTKADGRIAARWLGGNFRAYGFLVAARKKIGPVGHQ